MDIQYVLRTLTPGELQRARQDYRLHPTRWRERFAAEFPRERVKQDPDAVADLLEEYWKR